jgi:hypothetical protein
VDRPDGDAGTGLLGALLLVTGLVGCALWASIAIGPWRLASGLLDARDHLKAAEKALSDGRNKHARYETLAADAAVDRARRGFRTGGPAFDVAEGLPTLRNAFDEVEHLLDAADHSTEAGKGTLEVALSALKGPDKLIVEDPDDPKGGSRIRIARVQELEKLIVSIRADVVASRQALQEVDLDNLPRRIHGSVKEAIRTSARAQGLIADAEAGFHILPAALGAEGERKYLVGFQNSAEQRGTGGAMLQFQEITMDGGRLELSEASSVYKNVDRTRTPIDIPLPEDAWHVAGIQDAQRFGNANWSPDWPSSAQLTLSYGEATPAERPFPDFDGVILVDPVAVQKLIPGTGPFTTQSNNRISSGRAVHFLLYKGYASYTIAAKRRVVLNQVVDEFVERLLDPSHPTELVSGMGTALAQKHMQIWMRASEEQKFVKRMDWDGAIEPARGDDYLYVVEQNVGGNKLDYFDENRTLADIEINGDNAHHSTEMRVRNGVFLPQPRYSMGDTQSQRACSTTHCPTHRPMLSLYVQREARLVDWEVVGDETERLETPPPAVWVGGRPPTNLEKSKQVWTGTVQIPPQMEGGLRFDYIVPGVVHREGNRRVYRLHVQNQPKVRPEMLVVRLKLPEGATDLKAKGWRRDQGVLVWEKRLQDEAVLEVSWRE